MVPGCIIVSVYNYYLMNMFFETIIFLWNINPQVGGNVKGVIFKTQETTYQAILSS